MGAAGTIHQTNGGTTTDYPFTGQFNQLGMNFGVQFDPGAFLLKLEASCTAVDPSLQTFSMCYGGFEVGASW